MKTPTMVYKHPGIHAIHGDKFDYKIVDEDDIDSALADGWFLTTTEAKEASVKPAVEIPAEEQTTLAAQVMENVDAPRRGRTRKVTEVEVIPDSL